MKTIITLTGLIFFIAIPMLAFLVISKPPRAVVKKAKAVSTRAVEKKRMVDSLDRVCWRSYMKLAGSLTILIDSQEKLKSRGVYAH